MMIMVLMIVMMAANAGMVLLLSIHSCQHKPSVDIHGTRSKQQTIG